jgi:hypothetical protein
MNIYDIGLLGDFNETYRLRHSWQAPTSAMVLWMSIYKITEWIAPKL